MSYELQSYCNIKPQDGCQINWDHYLSKDLAAAWLMNEGGGSIVKDLVDNHHGSMINCEWTDGLDGPAILFSGVSGFIEIENKSGIFLHDESFSISARIFQIAAGPGNSGRIFNRRDANGIPGLVWFSDAGNSGRQHTFRGESSGTDLIKTTSMYVEYLEWQDWLLVNEGSLAAGGIRIYLNGKEVTYITNQNGSTLANNLAERLFIGGISTNTRTFRGKISHIYYWRRRVLSQDDAIALSYNPYCFIYPNSISSLNSITASSVKGTVFYTPVFGDHQR